MHQPRPLRFLSARLLQVAQKLVGTARNVGAQKCRARRRLDSILAKRRRNHPHLCRSVLRSRIAPCKVPGAFENDHQVEMFSPGSGRNGLRKCPFFSREVAARNKKSLSHRPTRGTHRLNFPTALVPETNYLERLLNVQFAPAALRVAPIVIVNAIRQIRMLLYLAEHQSRANRMRRPRRNENRITLAHGDSLQTFFRGSVADGLLESLAINSSLQSHQHLSTGPGPHCIPHLRLPAPTGSFLVSPRVLIVGMYLHRKLVLRENKFHEKRKRRTAINLCPSPFGRYLGPHAPERPPLKWSRSEAAFAAGHPSFAQRFLEI